jgi:AraC-like DNA-binding protein
MTTQMTSIYLLSNDQDSRWGLTVSTVGYQHIAPGEAYPPKGHPQEYSFQAGRGRVLEEYQFVYISSGHGIFESRSFGQAAVSEGDMFLLFPGEWHSYHPDTASGWDEYWIGFKGLNIDNRVSNAFFLPREPIFHVGLNEDIVHLYRNAITIAQEQGIGFQQMLGGVANMLQGYAFALNRHNTFEDSESAAAIHKAKIIMTEKFSQRIGPADVAEAINMGYSKFRRLFKEYTGYAPLQYLQELRLQRSKQLLTSTDLSLTEIADKVGYDNADYFSAAFKKKNHITPANYRKKR